MFDAAVVEVLYGKAGELMRLRAILVGRISAGE